MDLPSHFFFALAVGLAFFSGRPEAVLLMGFGALIPDLDREYWYVREKKYADEQYHRARLHNVFLIALAYLVSPYLSLGVFLHMLQDSFTTAKDRGVEWFYPLTRLVKRGMYTPDMEKEPLDPKEKVYFYQEDPKGYVSAADPDLREESSEPVPWRRVYGFAQNSHLLDRGFLFGSLVVVVILTLFPPNPNYVSIFVSFLNSHLLVWILAYVSVALLFTAGETQRRDKQPKVPFLKPVQFPLLIAGVSLLTIWFVLYSPTILSNLVSIFSNPIPIVLGVVLIPIVALVLVKYYTRGGREAIV